MPRETARKLTASLRDRVDDGLRTVVIVREADWEIHYLRADLKCEYTQEMYGEVVDTIRLEDPSMSPGVESRPVGERRGLVHYHENAFVVQFPVGETESVLVGPSREAGGELLAFLETCRELIESE